MRLKIADTVFEVFPHYKYAEKSAEGYLTDEKADYTINVPKEAIEKQIQSGTAFSPAYAEWLEIYRVICAYFEERDGIMMHGAVIGFENNAYMFTAPSGTGKTTHVRQWMSRYKDKVTVINGDKPIIRRIDGEYMVYGTPWCGKEHYNTNTKMPLKGIAILSRAEKNAVTRVNAADYLPQLLRQVYIHKTLKCASNAMDFMDKMFTEVPIYSLGCNISHEAAEIAREAMTVK